LVKSIIDKKLKEYFYVMCILKFDQSQNLADFAKHDIKITEPKTLLHASNVHGNYLINRGLTAFFCDRISHSQANIGHPSLLSAEEHLRLVPSVAHVHRKSLLKTDNVLYRSFGFLG